MASRFVAAVLLLIAASSALGQSGAPPEQELRRAVDARPRDFQARGRYGVFLQQQRRTAEAIVQFRAALDAAPDSANAAYNLALALLGAGAAAEALAVLEKHPADLADHFALQGAVLNALQRPADAAASLRRAVALDPGNPDSLYDLAMTLLKMDEAGESAALFESGRRRFPRIAKFHAGPGMVAYRNGKNEQAVRDYQTAVKLEPTGADLYAALGDVYDATGDLKRAGSAYAQALRLDASVAAYHVKAGRNLAKLQKPGEAELEFRRALEREPANADAHFQLGKLLAARDDQSGALSHFEQAVAADPALKAAWYQLSLSYRHAGRPDKSVVALAQFRKLP